VIDLTVAAVPFYFGSMGAERRYLASRAVREGPSAADYTREDAGASLAMGVGSLLAPFAAAALVKKVLPGKGRYPNALVRTAVTAAVVTTVADRLAKRKDRVGRTARSVAAVSGPVAVATGVVAVGTTVSNRLSPARMWAANRGRDLGGGVIGWTAAIAGWDFIYYWNHRFMHEVRALWAIHVVHHSSERYNLSTALRQPVADVFGVFLPYGLLARIGVRPRLIAQARGINLIYQYWIHTDAIKRLGPAEEVLNTPSHHRVHHGSNSRYIDRNHGSILIVWDRLFGTFEREGEPVVYGLTKNINTYNPARIASHEHWDILRDVARSDNWRDRLSFVFRGPGWAYRRHAERGAGDYAGVS
jgi:sterol desaturase/sphingolipid hydroxylase (fatty acid hydroxylase superfamily)